MILLTHPTGNAAVRHTALGLHRAGLLGEFWTGLNLPLPSWAHRLLPAGLCHDLGRRSFPEELRRKMRSHPWREGTRVLARRLGLSLLTKPGDGLCSFSAVCHSLDRQVARRLEEGRFTGIYGFEQGAEQAFRTARELNQVTLYEQIAGHWKSHQDLYEDEARLQPEWVETWGPRPERGVATDRSDAELSLAQVVFAPSTFVKRTLDRGPLLRARVAVIPQGIAAPCAADAVPARAPFLENGRLRVLYVGALSQRKGLSYLFSAVRSLGPAVELTVASRRPTRPCAALVEALGTCRHVVVKSPTDVFRLMHSHDVLVCPALFEPTSPEIGLALAAGLPVIASEHTTGPDLISEGVEGFVVPIRSSEAVAGKLDLLLSRPQLLRDMSAAGRDRAREVTWQRYEQTLALRVNEAMALAGHGTSSSFSPALPTPPLPGVFPRGRV